MTHPRPFTNSEICDLTVGIVQYLKKWHGGDVEPLLGVDVKRGVTPPTGEVAIIAEQLDALVDIVYYIFNYLAKQDDVFFVDDPYFGEMYAGVQQFTRESKPILLTEEEEIVNDAQQRDFIVQMVLSEVCELLDTVIPDSVEVVRAVITTTRGANVQKQLFSSTGSATWHYMYHIVRLCELYARKLGFEFSDAFNVVHQANMNKRDPETGRFELRDDGKVIKPPGWQPPDMEAFVREKMSLVPTTFWWNTIKLIKWYLS